MSGNRQVIVRRYPDGVPEPADFSVREAPVPEPGEGEALVRAVWLSMDPFTRMQLTAAPGGPPAVPLGATMIGRGVGRVVRSRAPDLAEGDWVAADLGWQDYAVVGAGARRIDPALGPVSAALGALGPSGIAAVLMLETGGAARGETVAVTAAAGSVGTVACQAARVLGCEVVPIGHGKAQVDFLRNELRFGRAVAAADALPGGIDLAIDTVGGTLHEALTLAMKPRGRIVLGGFISAYGGDRPRYVDPYAVVFKRLTLIGFLAGDHAARFQSTLTRLASWVRDGSVRVIESVTDGLENAPAAFAALFAEARPGKQLVRVVSDDTV